MNGPVAIEVRDVAKTFRIPKPGGQVPLRTRLLHPLSYPARELEALKSISFDVQRGEMFGVIGRNGCGKSTLLRLIAGTYAADRGTIRVAGRVAPFLELGIGFNPQLPAYDNAVINGVMIGLTPAEARRRADRVIDFAGLREFTDLTLRKYSSGMRARLGFAVMTHVDADVLLVDEVLAVGDIEFAERCDAVFRQLHSEGRTIVLVSHSMDSVAGYCERAMLIEDGRVEALGSSVDVINRYMEVTSRRAVSMGSDPDGRYERLADTIADPPARVHDARIVDAEGDAITELAPGEPVRLRAEIELVREIPDPSFYFTVSDSKANVVLAGSEPGLANAAGVSSERVELHLEMSNRLTAGRYVLGCGINQTRPDGGAEPATRGTFLGFRVAGEPGAGPVAADHTVSFEPVSGALR